MENGLKSTSERIIELALVILKALIFLQVISFFFFFWSFQICYRYFCSQKLVEILFCSCFVLCFSKKHGLEICSLILHSWNFVNHCFNPEIYLNGMKMIYRAIHSCNFIFFHLWLYLIDLENYITSIKW